MHGGHLHVRKFRPRRRLKRSTQKIVTAKCSGTLWCCISYRIEALAKLTKEFPAWDLISEKCIFVTQLTCYPGGSWRAANPIWEIWAIKDIGYTRACKSDLGTRRVGQLPISLFWLFSENCQSVPYFVDISNSLLFCYFLPNLKKSCTEHYCSR